MLSPTNGPARQTFPARERVDADLLERMIGEGSIIIDNRRRRPLYFDGRFLAARDLTREQNYFLSRQSDVGRVAGGGVIHGLMVSNGSTATSIRIEPGHGITSAGEILVLDERTSIELTNITEMQRLNTALGISRIPSEPSRNRSGLFIVALRPVEFTANPIASYPTSISGTRSVEDGDIIEAVAVTLVPYLDQSSNTDFLSRRAHAAREIFVNRATRGIPSATLPLAMIALDRGVIRWIDPFMVRREVGAEHGNTIGLGLAPRALRESHLLQYEEHLAEVLRLRATRGLRFAASEHFQCLPPAGHVPAGTIDPSDFSQMYFPAEIDVDLSIVPADEVPVLLEESMFLPPIDLTLSGTDQDSTSVQILIPVPRERLRLLLSSLTSTTRALKPAAPGLVARRKPLESLQTLALPRSVPVSLAPAPADSVWAGALVIPGDRMLWYVRRRNLQYKSEFVGTEVRTAGEESEAEKKLIDQLKTVGLSARFDSLSKVSTAVARAELVTFLDSPKFVRSKLMMVAAVRELEEKVVADAQLERNEVLTVEDRFSDAQAGEGIRQLENISEGFKDDAFIKTISETFAVPQVDRLVRPLAQDVRETFARRLLEAGAGGNVAALSKLIAISLSDGVAPDISKEETVLLERLKKFGLGVRFNELTSKATADTRAALARFLGQTKFGPKLMIVGAFRDLEIRFAADRNLEAALRGVSEHFSYTNPATPGAPPGFGIERFEEFEPFRNDKFVNPVADTQMVPEVDQIFAVINLQQTGSERADELLNVATTGDNKSLLALIAKTFKAVVTPAPVPEIAKEEAALTERLQKIGLSASFAELAKAATAASRVEMVKFLGAAKFARSPLLMTAAVRELESKFAFNKQFETTLKAVVDRFSSVGEGITTLEKISEEYKSQVIVAMLAGVQMVPELDQLIKSTTDKATLINSSDQILKMAQSGNTKGMVALIRKLTAELKK